MTAARFIDIEPWDCTDAEYYDGAAVGSTTLAKAIFGDFGGDPKRLQRGSANHVAIILPEYFDNIVHLQPPEVRIGSNEEFGPGQKTRMKEWIASLPPRAIPLNPTEYAAVKSLHLATLSNAWLQAELRKSLWREQSFRCIDRVTGLTVRIRVDIARKRLIVDPKTTGTSVTPAGFERHVYSMGYCLQAALYVDIWTALYGKPPAWAWLPIMDSPPHYMGHRFASESQLAYGRRLYNAGLLAMRSAYETGRDPTPWWEKKAMVMGDPPPWVYTDLERIEEHVGVGT